MPNDVKGIALQILKLKSQIKRLKRLLQEENNGKYQKKQKDH